MKSIITILIMLSITISTVLAQAPEGIKYQAIARDASGEVMANQQVDITIGILQGDVNGTEVFLETHALTTNGYGLVTLNIGAVNTTDFAAIQWANGPYFVEVSMDGNVMGVSQLLSVPYAKYADEAGNTFSGSFNDLADVPANIDLDATDDFSGDYTDLTNTPAIPADLADLSDNSSLLFDGDYNSLTNLPTLFSGNYSDLTGKPVIADSIATYGFSGSFNDLADVPTNIDLDATDDFSGDYTDLINTPAIPTDIADLSDNSSLLFDGDYNSLTNLPTLFSGNYSDLTGKPVIADSVAMYGFSGSFNDLADVPANIDLDATDDFSGDYTDLINTPDLSIYSTTDTTLDENEVDVMVSNNGYAMQTGLNDTASNIRGDLAAVAISGDYADLSNAPDLSDTANYAYQSALEDTASSLRNDLAPKNNVLALDNTTAFTPNADYEPATKKYVDDNVGGGSTYDFYLGQDTLGGIVFYIYLDANGNQHGLIVSKTEKTAQWQSTTSTTNATRSWDGVYNMNLMTNSPAKTWVTGLGADWYLPSIDELSLLWHNRFHANKGLNDAGATLLSNTAYYWSSTELNATRAFNFGFGFGDGNTNPSYKTYTYSVRAVRAF